MAFIFSVQISKKNPILFGNNDCEEGKHVSDYLQENQNKTGLHFE